MEYIRQTTLLKNELDWQSGMAHAKERGLKKGLKEGLKKGRNEGRNEASLDIAQKMKAMGFLTEQIQAVTDLSTEAIAKL